MKHFLKKQLLALFLVSLGVDIAIAASGTTIEVATAGALANAVSKANSSTTDIELKLSGTLTPMGGLISFMNSHSNITIYLTGPAVVSGKLLVSPSNAASIVITQVTFDEIIDNNNKVTVRTADASTSFPDNLTALASSQRQVYFGFSKLVGVTSVAVEKSDDETSWTVLSENDLERRDDQSAEPTQVGWQSIRYLAATPGASAFYRLVATTSDSQTFTSETFSVTTAQKGCLHSRPGAKATIYLDFDGFVDDYSGNASAAGTNFIQAPVFEDRSAISNVWRSVAEDFAVFDVDVTTEEPPHDRLVKSDAEDDQYGKRVVFDQRTGDDKWYKGAGGVSGLGAFGFRTDRPAFIFGATTDNIACQATHEVSHTLGLVHDGGVIDLDGYQRWDVEKQEWVDIEGEKQKSEYYSGKRVSLNCMWYPVMGGVPTNNGADYINQFSDGNYDTATNDEDDFAVITGQRAGAREGNVVVFPTTLYPGGTEEGFWKLKLLADDVGDDIATATSCDGRAAAIISPNDTDVFCFDAGKGPATIKVSPEYQGSSYGSSLDAKVELLDTNGAVLAASENPLQGDIDDGEFRKAELSLTLSSAGRYYVRVSGTFHETTGCATNAYGSVGPYVLTIESVKGLKHSAPRILIR